MCRLSKLLILPLSLLYFMGYASAQELAVKNTSRYAGNGRWDWTIFVDANTDTLNRIQCVEYTLHPTFSNPIRQVCTPKNNFTLSTSGWGTFEVQVRVIFQDGSTRNLKHQLKFEAPVAAPKRGKISVQNTAFEKEKGWWAWTISINSDQETLAQIRCVEYTLHPTFPNPVQTVCDPKNKFALSASGWGTFEVILKVLFKDGSVLPLKHQLRF